MNYILGASGLIGSAIRAQLSTFDYRIIPRIQYEKWEEKNEIGLFLKSNSVSPSDRFFICSGLTDPKCQPDQLNLHNLEIPLQLITGIKEFEAEIITFGTILENSDVENPYINSKRKFFEKACLSNRYSRHLHFQLHTVYGLLAPKKHMLLGRFLDAIRDEKTFEMTSGKQYREYWHAQDVAKFVFSRNWATENENFVPVSSGQPIQIADLAIKVFERFSQLELLKLGFIPDDPRETYNSEIFLESYEGRNYMREPIEGVITYLNEYLQEPNYDH